MKTLTSLGLATVTLVCTTLGCSAGSAEKVAGPSGGGTGGTVRVTVTVPETITITVTENGAPTSPAPTGSGGVAEFGAEGGFTYTDGLVVVVPTAGTFRPGRYAVGTKAGNAAVKVTVEIRNDSNKVFDPTLFSASMSYGTKGNQAEQIFDSENGIGGGFTTSVPPGRTATALFAFSVPPDETDDLLLQVSPDFDHDDALFQGSVR